MAGVRKDGKRKRKSEISSPELGMRVGAGKSGLGRRAEDEDDDGVHGGRMKPLSSLDVNQSVVQQQRGLDLGLMDHKKALSPSTALAAAKITERARERARMCLLDDNKENGPPRVNPPGFRPFRGTKRKTASLEGSVIKAASQVTYAGLPSRLLSARKLDAQAYGRGSGTENGGGAGVDAIEAVRGLFKLACESSSEGSEDRDVQTVPIQVLGFQTACTGSEAGCSDGLAQSSQDSSRPVVLLDSKQVACVQALRNERGFKKPCNASDVEGSARKQHEVGEKCEGGVTILRPGALPVDAEVKMGPASLRQIRHQLSCASMQFKKEELRSSSQPTVLLQSNGNGSGIIREVKPKATGVEAVCKGPVPTFSHSQKLLPSRIGTAGSQTGASPSADQYSRIINQHIVSSSANSRSESSGHSTLRVRVNPNLTRQSSLMSSSQPLPPTGRKTRVFKTRADSLGGLGGEVPFPHNRQSNTRSVPQRTLDNVGDEKVNQVPSQSQKSHSAPGNTGFASMSLKFLPQQSRFAPNYLPLPSRQRAGGRPRKTSCSKSRSALVDAARDVRRDSTRKVIEVAEPSGLLGEFNPGIISRIRDSKQVQAILGAVVGPEAIEALAEQRRLKKETEEIKQAEAKSEEEAERREQRQRLPVTDGANRSGRNVERQQTGVDVIASGCTDVANGAAVRAELSGSGGCDRRMQDSNLQCHQTSNATLYSQVWNGDVRLGGNAGVDVGTKTDCDASDAEDLFSMDPNLCTGASAACRWLELLVMDMKGRIAALKRSRRRFRNVLCSGELDILTGAPGASLSEAHKDGSSDKQELQGLQMSRWKKLFMSMDGMLSMEGGKLESSLKQVTDLQINCRHALEFATEPIVSELPPAEKRKREMALAASAANVFSTAHLTSSMLCM